MASITVANKKADLMEAYAKLGEYIFPSISGSSGNNPEMQKIFSKITEKQTVFDEAVEEYSRSRGVKVCMKCLRDVNPANNFCSACGTKVEDHLQKNKKRCCKCGEVLSSEDCFCAFCGALQEELI